MDLFQSSSPDPSLSPNRRRSLQLLRKRSIRLLGMVVVLAFILRLSGCMETLFYHPQRRPVTPPRHLTGLEVVRFESRDGTRLHGWFIPGQGGSETERLPSILHVHGNAGNIESHVWFSEHLPPAGFNLFIFDYRGYGESEGRSRKRADLIADTHAALDTLLARDEVDPNQVGLYGQSLGGAIGMWVAAERPEVRVVVLESPFSSWRGVAANAVGGDPPNWIGRFLAWLLIFDTCSPLDASRRFDRPLLILHGDADRIIPINHGRALAAAAPQGQCLEYKGGKHNSLRDSHPDMMNAMIEFFRKHMHIDDHPESP